jgi:signal transduction histidine kinase
MGSASDESLSFADGPKVELDQLIDQLVELAQGVKRAQGRLRGLLRATEHVTGDPDLKAVLQHAAEAACALTGARYGALGVIAPDGGLEQFIHVGIDDDLLARIGHLPEGNGLLGALITDPRPIRLRQIADDPRSSGFPDGHPDMGSFLGVPIRVRDEVFGNLYLTESEHGQFSVEDEELLGSLAVTVGTAISHARLYDELRLQQRWLAASAEISAQLLSVSGEDPLRMIARRASEVAGADLVTVCLLDAAGSQIMVEVAVGIGADQLVGRTFPTEGTLSGDAILGGQPLLLRSAQLPGARPSHVSSVMDAGPVMVVPLVGTGTVLGALSIARLAGRPVFSAADLTMAAGFANHANVALELATARNDQQRVVLLEDRDRIARDLHDHVIQQLFAIGMSVQSVANQVSANEPAAEKLLTQVGYIDRTIRQIRTSIFELRGPMGSDPSGLRQVVLEIAAELSATLGFPPSVTFAGAVDALVTGEVADDVVACVREGLTNVAKHALAGQVAVDVSIEGELVVVSIADDGVGIPAQHRPSGLTNLQKRAQRRHGSFELSTSVAGGTQLLWKARIS